MDNVIAAHYPKNLHETAKFSNIPVATVCIVFEHLQYSKGDIFHSGMLVLNYFMIIL